MMAGKKFAISKASIRRLVPHSSGCFATDRITVDGAKIGYMYRESGDFPEDTGWRFFAGDESEEYINDDTNMGVYAVNTIANYDPDILPYLDTPVPCAFEKIDGSCYYRLVTD
jgi:hypothetical protein